MPFRRSFALTFCILSVAAIASAQSEAKSGPAAKAEVGFGFKSDVGKTEAKADVNASATSEAKPAGGATKDAVGVRRDPKGKKGVSPFWEAIRRGDEAALAKDFSKAQEAYQVAIDLDPKSPLAQFRKGQILVRGGHLPEAEAAYRDAMNLADKDGTIRAAALFVLADLKERQGKRDEAIAAWKAYADYLKSDPSAKGYPDTAVERDKRLKTYNELVVESKAVRERIELRIKELDEANKRKAAKNPNAGK